LHWKTSATPLQKSNSVPPDKECKSKVAGVELHTILPPSDYWFTSSSRQYSGANYVEVSEWTKSTDQPAESNYHMTVFGSEINEQEIDMGEGVTTYQFCAGSVQSDLGKKCIIQMEKSQLGIEGMGVGRRNVRRDSDNSASVESGSSTRTSLNSKEQVLDNNNTKNDGGMVKNAQFYSSSNCQVTNSELVSDKQEFNSTELVQCEGSGSVRLAKSCLDEVDVGRGLEHKSSVTFCSDSIAEYSSQYRPSFVTDNGIQARDNDSEIKNARNMSENKVLGCEIDVHNPCNSITEDYGFVSKCLDVSLNWDKTNSTIMSCDESDQFLECSETVHKNARFDCDDSCVSNLHGDTSLSHAVDSTKHFEASEDRMCSRNFSVADECHKKDESNECQMEEQQNRKNSGVIKGNSMSDVLIISDPVPVTETMAPSTQISCSSKNKSLSDSVLKEEKSAKLKSESVTVDTSGPDLIEQPAKQHKSSSPSSLLPMNLNPDECTWDMLFDDNGECLDPKLMEEVSTNNLYSVPFCGGVQHCGRLVP
jgi:hypothetical protein